MEMYSGPHQRSNGKRFASSIRTRVRKAVDHLSGVPIAVDDQSNSRMRAPISPPLERDSNSTRVLTTLGRLHFGWQRSGNCVPLSMRDTIVFIREQISGKRGRHSYRITSEVL